MQLSRVTDWESQRHAQGTGICGARGAMQRNVRGCRHWSVERSLRATRGHNPCSLRAACLLQPDPDGAPAHHEGTKLRLQNLCRSTAD